MKTKLFLKFGIITLPFFLSWLFEIATAPLFILFSIMSGVENPSFALGMINSMNQMILRFIFLGISVYIAIKLWFKYIERK